MSELIKDLNKVHQIGDSRFTLKLRHISVIRAGDVIYRDDKLCILGKKDIKYGFMGKTLWGDSYRLGRESVVVAEIIHVRPSIKTAC